MKIRYQISYILLPLLLAWNNIERLLKKDRAAIRILMFHNIPEGQMERFGVLVEYLNKKYRLISPTQFEKLLKGAAKANKLNILLTFDDGFLSNKTVADKILSKYNAKAIFFAATDFIGLKGAPEKEFVANKLFHGNLSEKYNWLESAPMSRNNLNELIANGHEIGCHTRSHKNLGEVTNKETLQKEIVASKEILSNKLNKKINHFAYPFGNIESINKTAMNLIKDNYRFCFSAVRGFNDSRTNRYGIFRDDINPSAPIAYNRFVIEGGLDLFYRKARKKLYKML